MPSPYLKLPLGSSFGHGSATISIIIQAFPGSGIHEIGYICECDKGRQYPLSCETCVSQMVDGSVVKYDLVSRRGPSGERAVSILNRHTGARFTCRKFPALKVKGVNQKTITLFPSNIFIIGDLFSIVIGHHS
jgi:hypothetical protein